MIAKFAICLFLGAAACYCDLLIRDVTVIDVASGAARPKSSILIRGEKIASVGNDFRVPPNARIISGAGRYLIPGLWDMHVHLAGREQLPAYLAFGITGVRDMGSDLDRTKAWRTDIQSGKMSGPHVETCGPAVDGFPSDDPKVPVKMIRSPNEARTLFDRLDDQNVDFIGVLPRLPRDAYFALIERARKWYSSVAGDVPSTVTVLEAIDARQRSIDHMSGIALACSTEEKKLRDPMALSIDRRDWEAVRNLELAALENFSAEKADALFRRMAVFETRSVPVLVSLHASEMEKSSYEKLAQLLIRMQRNGVVVLAGSDSGIDGARPGEQLHEELELLVAAGLTPAQALRSATLDAVKFIDADEALGAVEQGKTADLVLLDANPLSDIRNTRKIAGVIVGGKYIPRARPVHK